MDIKEIPVTTEVPSTEPDQLALTAIERICGDDFCEDQCMRNIDREDGDLKTAIDKLTTVYILCHSHVKSHSCYHAHDSWRARVAEILAEDPPA